MKRAALASILFARIAAAAPAGELEASADGPDDARGEVTRLVVRDSVTVDHPGATAAFAVDSDIVEVAAHDGRITLTARRAGTTTVSVVTARGLVTFSLTVVAPDADEATATKAKRSTSYTLWHEQYDSLTTRLTNGLEMVSATDKRTLRAAAVNVVRLEEPVSASDTDARASFPVLSLEYKTKTRELVVGDANIDHSQLTLDGVTVRGGHARVGGLQLHAGITSPVLYQNVFLSTQRELVLGASYAIGLTKRSSLTPSVYSYPSDPQTGGSSGTMGSLMYRYASKGDHLRIRSELGWGGTMGAAGELTYEDEHNRAWVSARHQPRDFAALGIGRPLGSVLEGVYTAEPSKELAVNIATTAAQYEIGEHTQNVVTASVETRAKIAPRVATSLGMASGQFSGTTMTESVRSITVPVGLHYDTKRFGASATYRYQQNTARNTGGHGGRLSMRASRSGFYASTFADVQQEAATLDLVLRSEPGLAQLLTEMGLTASSTDDLARLLRDSATLAQLGYAEQPRLDFSPLRAQVGGDLAWIKQDKTRQQLRLRALLNRTEGVSAATQTATVSLAYGRRLGKAVEVNGMVSWWARDAAMAIDTWSFGAGMRVRFDTVPRLPRWGARDLEGVVVDADADAPVRGATIRLDNGRTARTDASGRFRFADVAGGAHRVSLDAPDGMYFTGASEQRAEAGDAVRFELARASSRVIGTVRDDAGRGLAGVTLVLRGTRGDRTVITDSNGHYAIASGDGDYVLEPSAGSLPPGYDLDSLAAEPLHLARGETIEREHVVRAQRTISGVIGAGSHATVRIVELDRAEEIDEDGHYLFRGLPAGIYTVEVVVGKRRWTRSVQLPAAPTTIRDINFVQ